MQYTSTVECYLSVGCGEPRGLHGTPCDSTSDDRSRKNDTRAVIVDLHGHLRSEAGFGEIRSGRENSLDPLLVVLPVAQHFAPFEKPFSCCGPVRSQRAISYFRAEGFGQWITYVFLIAILPLPIL